MEDFRRFPKSDTRQIIDYNRFISLTGEKVFICLDKGVMEIARYLLNTRGLFRSTYVKEYVGTIGYNMPTVEEFQAVQAAIAEANEEMSTCEEIAEALNGIKTALLSMAQGAGAGCGSCGGGSRGAGTSEAAPDEFFDDGENYPSSFSSREEFDQARCNRAYDIVDNLKADLQGLAGINYGIESSITVLATTLITVLLTPIPYDDILFLIGLLIYTAIAYSFLVEFSSEVFDNRDNLACILYSAADSGSAQVAFRAELDALIIGQSWTDPTKSFVSEVVTHLTPLDAINLLYSNVPTVNQDTDCSACGPEDFWFIDSAGSVFGTLISGSLSGNCVIESGYGPLFGANRDYLFLTATGSPQESGFTIDSVPDVGEDQVQMNLYDESVTLVYDTGFTTYAALVSESHTGIRHIQIWSLTPDVNNPFRIEFTLTD